MAFGALIPVVGTAIVWLPGALFLLFTGKTVAGVALIIWGALAVGNIDNVLRPVLAGGDIGVPMPLLLVGMIGGAVSFGPAGAVLGSLVPAAGLVPLEEGRRPHSAAETPPPADA